MFNWHLIGTFLARGIVGVAVAGRNGLISAAREENRRKQSSSKREYIRMAVGQLPDYAFQGKQELGEPNKAILLPKRPEAENEKWLTELHIAVIWPNQIAFRDNAGGQFAPMVTPRKVACGNAD